MPSRSKWTRTVSRKLSDTSSAGEGHRRVRTSRPPRRFHYRPAEHRQPERLACRGCIATRHETPPHRREERRAMLTCPGDAQVVFLKRPCRRSEP